MVGRDAKFGLVEPITVLDSSFLAVANETWDSDFNTLYLTITFPMWGDVFVNGYRQRTADYNTQILQTFEDVLRAAWESEDRAVADGMDWFANVLEVAIESKKLPSKDVLLKDVKGSYLSNIL